MRKWPVLIETGSHPSPDGTIVLSLVSTFNNASGERTLKPIHKSLANAWLFQEINCVSINSISVFRLWVCDSFYLCHIKGLINDLLWLVPEFEFTEACTGIIIRFAILYLVRTIR